MIKTYTDIPENVEKLMNFMKKEVPEITLNQMEFMKQRKQRETVEVNGISVDIQPYMFPPKSPYSYSTRVLLDNMSVLPHERVLEIGTGCGILSVYAAKQGAKVDGVDILPECVEFSLRNAIQNGVFESTRFFYSNMFSNIIPSIDSKYGTILCNLPILEGELPDDDPRWLSLYDPGFKFHKELFLVGDQYAKRILIAHANLRGNEDFEKLENLAGNCGWETGKVTSKEYSNQEWRSYEFLHGGGK